MPDLQKLTPKRKRVYHPPLVFSMHGIRTDGEWQKIFASVLSGSQTRVESFDYGRYGLHKFLLPFMNNRKIDEFYRRYADDVSKNPTVALDNFDARPSAVAHSFGTWILGYAMLKHADMRFDKLILAGSILPRDFDWGTLFARDQVSAVLNECGQKDPWPAFAHRFVGRAGTAGALGFDWFDRTVQNKQSEWFGHSDALMRPHIEHIWVPFLLQEPSPLAIIHGRDIKDRTQFSNWLDHTGTIIDAEAYAQNPNYPVVTIPRGLSMKWIRINPDIYTFLVDRKTQEPAGYINAMPITDQAYEQIRQGKLNDNEITATDLLPFQDDQPVKIYLMSIAIAEKHRRWGEGLFQTTLLQLLNGFVDKLTYYAKQNSVRVTHLLATSWTKEGYQLCKLLGLQQIGKDQFGDEIWELDLQNLDRQERRIMSPALKRLLRTYERVLQRER